ncbi:MAG: SemiSWEET transporter [Caulobacteraceae bacterium]|jgi:MtN3 and saliva related transmembrane protein
MSVITLIGLAAAFLTTSALVPQAVRAWRTRSTGDLSLPAYVAYVTGIALWLVYGLILRDPPLIAANAISLLVGLAILGLKLRHG